MSLTFFKMHGCGNDFLIFDALDRDPRLGPEDAVSLCNRHFGIGADGLIVLKQSNSSSAEWDFLNNDGSTAEMCGNGARCAVRYLFDRYHSEQDEVTIETLAGVIRGKRNGEKISVTLPLTTKDFKYREIQLQVDKYSFSVYNINTGVPHAVIEVKDLRTYPIAKVGRAIQKHAVYQEEGTNVTFFQRGVGSQVLATTFERGVEAETFACGTGAAAASIVFSELYLQKFPVDVAVPGGDLVLDIDEQGQLWLTGPAIYVFQVEVAGVEIVEPRRLYGDRKSQKAPVDDE